MKTALEYSKDFDIDRQVEYAVKGITKVCRRIGAQKAGFAGGIQGTAVVFKRI